MSLTEEQIKILKALNESDILYSFPKIEDLRDSYFEEYEENSESVCTLDFSTIPELIELLGNRKKIIKSKQCDVLCAVEVFKNKSQCQSDKNDKISDQAMELPEYIYNF